ncbi:hypothetical protein ACQKL5_16270 [Peribacillus sp. NPDC097675]|uniref:hypothetical protein n=1 Tax=Peribacillus sp. NPDC097675 TaxID=3390618 RepID=UPI003D07074D
MRLHFEEWIKDQRISHRTEELINEAIICYRAKAYKASLLFSYLSFQNIIKERILSADPPLGYASNLWGNIQRELRDDDKWESKIIECIDRNKPGSIFRLSDDVKKQYFYWKDRRNDCAHGKDNKIGISHVETFWLFVESNLSKFGVNGGKESLLERIKVFFDTNLTPPHADPLPIIRDIPYAIEPIDYTEVLDIIFDYTEIEPMLDWYDDVFWIKILTIESEFRVHAVNYLKTKKHLILHILSKDPSNLIYFSEDPVFIRSLWKEESNHNKSHILISILRHRLIPKEQFKEFVSTVSSVIDRLLLNQNDETVLKTLEESGFWTEFKLLAFDDYNISDFNWSGDHRNLICYLILKDGFDEDIVKSLNYAFSGNFTPWKLGKSLDQLFTNNPTYKIEYKRITEETGGTLPERFFPEEF